MMNEEPKLYTIAVRGDVEAARDLLRHGVDIDNSNRDPGEETPLTQAIWDGHHNAVEILLSLGANPDAPGLLNVSPLELSIIEHDARIANLLLRHGANPNTRDPDSGWTPMHACGDMFVEAHNVAQIARALHAQGADVNARNIQGRTPLHLAAIANNVIVAKTLLELGADVNSIDYGGRTPGHLAAKRGNAGMLELLVRHGADLFISDAQGLTPGDEALRYVNSNLDPNRPRTICPTPPWEA